MKKELGIGILLVVVCVVVAIINPRFLGAANLANQARLIGMNGIFSIGWAWSSSRAASTCRWVRCSRSRVFCW